MSAPVPTRAAIDRAEPLFDRPRKEMVLTIHAMIDGFSVDLNFTGSIEQLPAAIKRLRELGAEPQSSAPAPAAAPLQRRASVTYNDAGEPLCGNANCSRYGKPLEPSQHNGYFCKGKDDKTGNQKGYCRSKAD